MSYEKKLMEMKKLLKKKPLAEDNEPSAKQVVISPPSYEANWLAAGLEKETNAQGIVYKKVIQYPLDYMHGDIPLSALPEALQQWIDANEQHPLAPDESMPLVFFDTETTGLKGAGTLIFLLGFLEQIDGCFQMTQYVLAGPDHEAAFLYASPFWSKPANLVTYNGKSFDWPQVETRWTMNRDVLPPLIAQRHIDLLHGSRRLWKDEMGTFRLPAVEESQLGFYRKDDIPGYMAPIIYQDAVKQGHAELLMKVLLHNEWDILSLAALFIRSTELVLQTEVTESAGMHTNIGKWFSDLKSYERSSVILEQVIEDYGNSHPLSHYYLGFLLKRNERWKEAAAAFQTAAHHLNGRERIQSFEELAKLYEHKLKDLENAMDAVQAAKSLLHGEEILTERFTERMKTQFNKREMRLFRKLFPGEAHKPTK